MTTDAIDCDVHCAPADWSALTPYLDDYWRSYVERARVPLTGLGHAYPAGAPTSIADDLRGAIASGAGAATYDALRATLLERDEPRVAVLVCATPFETHRSPYFAAAVARAVNEWLREEWLARDPRLRASVAVAAADPEAAAEEVARVGDDPRFVQVLLPVRADAPYGAKRWHPLLRAAAERDLPVAIHAWGRPGLANAPSGFAPTYFEEYVGNATIAHAHVASLVAEGAFTAFGDLRVVLLECGFAWLPPLAWRMDKDWKSLWREIPWARERPSSAVAERVYATIAPAPLPHDPQQAREQLEIVGVERLLYASDHPHDHGPGTARALAALDADGAEAVLRGNAAALYRLGA